MNEKIQTHKLEPTRIPNQEERKIERKKKERKKETKTRKEGGSRQVWKETGVREHKNWFAGVVRWKGKAGEGNDIMVQVKMSSCN